MSADAKGRGKPGTLRFIRDTSDDAHHDIFHIYHRRFTLRELLGINRDVTFFPQEDAWLRIPQPRPGRLRPDAKDRKDLKFLNDRPVRKSAARRHIRRTLTQCDRLHKSHPTATKGKGWKIPRHPLFLSRYSSRYTLVPRGSHPVADFREKGARGDAGLFVTGRRCFFVRRYRDAHFAAQLVGFRKFIYAIVTEAYLALPEFSIGS